MFHPPRPELFEPERPEATPPLPPAPPPPQPATPDEPPVVIPPEPGAPQVTDVVMCVGQFYNIDFGGYVGTFTALPEGLTFQGNQFLVGTPTESFCGDVTLNAGTSNERRFRLVAIDAQTFIPRLTPEISPGYTFSEQEGNYSEACGIVNFSAKFKRHYIRNYSIHLGSTRPLLWQDDLLLNLEPNDANRLLLHRYQLPTLTQKTLQKDASFTPVDITALGNRRDLALAPVVGGQQYFYFTTGFYPDIKLRRYNLTTQALDTAYEKDVDYFRGNTNMPTDVPDIALVPQAIAVNSNRIYVFLSAIGSYESGISQSEWYKYDLNWRTYIGSIVQSYTLDGNLQVGECQENLRVSGSAGLPFVIESEAVEFSYNAWKSSTREGGAGAEKQPGVFATDDAIYMVALQGSYYQGHNYPFLLEFPLVNHVVTRNSTKALLIDGIDDNIQGLHRTADGDFYMGLVTDQSGGFAQLGGQETRGMIKISGGTFDRVNNLEYLDQAIDYVEMEPPVGNVISSCLGTVGNARGQGNLSIQTYAEDVANKIRIYFPVDYADSAEIYVTGQYKVDG